MVLVNIAIGFASILAAIAFVLLVVAPVLRLVYGAPPREREFKDHYGRTAGARHYRWVTKDDGKPFVELRATGHAVLKVEMGVAAIAAIAGALWLLGSMVSAVFLSVAV